MTAMYEIDFLPVEAEGGNGTKSGDAIAGRLWLPDGSSRVLVVDAGYSAIGDDIVDHIQTYYNTDTVDLVVSTHPDSDHLNGLLQVVESMTVRELLIHRPRYHLPPADVAYFKNLEMVDAVIQAAETRGVTVTEPFVGLTRWGGQVRVLGPSAEYYEHLISQHVSDEQSGRAAAKSAAAKALSTALATSIDLLSRVLPFLPEETLQENPVTSDRNNTSTVLLLESVDFHRILLTSDAGVQALNLAANEYERHFGSLDGTPPSVFQVTHHGSRNNVSPSLLDRIVGPKGSIETVSAVISSAKLSPYHPSPKVTNALLRRGAHVVATEGRTICAYAGPPRYGWSPVPSITAVDEDE
jgi:beta-lactamase superfamily II metal-dependent hydrolase